MTPIEGSKKEKRILLFIFNLQDKRRKKIPKYNLGDLNTIEENTELTELSTDWILLKSRYYRR